MTKLIPSALYMKDMDLFDTPSRTGRRPKPLSAVLAGKAELREVIDKALERRKLYQKKTILFVKQVVETLNLA